MSLLQRENIGAPCPPAQAGCMRQVLGPRALGRPRGIDREGGGRGDRDGNTCKSMTNSCQYMKKKHYNIVK